MVMTLPELRALGLAMYGPEWQSPLARAVGMSPRNMRRIVAGKIGISAKMEKDIKRVLGATDATPAEWPRDAWIVGDGPENTGRREYVIHARPPRFIGRIVAIDMDTLQPDPDEGEADVLTGISYAAGDSMICEIVWIDPPPGSVGLAALMEEAADALEKA